MLYLETSLQIEGVTLFRDYGAPNRYYYLPRSPRLSVEDGQPMFQLLIYRRDITDNPDFQAGDRPGGGFLTMTVDVGVDSATLEAIKAQLARGKTGDEPIDLVPVPFERGSVRVSALGTTAGTAPGLNAAGEDGAGAASRTPRFVENILGSSRPSLYGDNRCVFSIELSHEGAQLMRASLEDGSSSQLAVIYELEYKGLNPAYEATITLHFEQSYSYLRGRFGLNTLWFRTDIDAEVERLVREGHIEIRDVDYLGLEPARAAERAEKLNQLAKELAASAFFRPGLTPGSVLSSNRGELQAADPTAAASQVTSGFSTPVAEVGKKTPAGAVAEEVRGQPTTPSAPTETPAAPTETPAAPTETPAAPTETPAAPTETPAAPTETPGSPTETPAAPAETPEPPTPGDAHADGGDRSPSAVESWNQAGRPQAAFLLRAVSQEEQQTITYDLRQVAATTRTAAPQGSIRVLSGAKGLAKRIQEVDLNDPFFERVSGSVTTTADLAAAGVGSMVVKLRYGFREDGTFPKDTAEVVLRSAGDKGDFAFLMDRRLSVDLEYQVVLTYKAGFAIGATETQAESGWIRTTTRNLDIDPRAVGPLLAVTLTTGNVDWTRVKSVQATVIYDDPESRVHGERTVVLRQDAPSSVVPIRPKVASRRAYRVKASYFYPTIEETVELAQDGELTVVLNPPTTRAVTVSLSLADPLARLRKVGVELSYAPPSGAEQAAIIDLDGDGASAAWTFFRPDEHAEPKYRYKVALFGRDGTSETAPWVETKERQLIVGDLVAAMLEVEVRVLVPDFAASGLLGAKVRLVYPDAPAWADPDVEKFFEEGGQAFRWRVPRVKGASKRYRYEVEWIKANGTIVKTGPEESEAESLLVLPPQA